MSINESVRLLTIIGDIEGFSEGLRVGAVKGDWEGCVEGVVDGLTGVGDTDAIGFPVGHDVEGDRVGVNDGETDGIFVGTPEVGKVDGRFEGDVDGATEGYLLGLSDGETLGVSVRLNNGVVVSDKNIRIKSEGSPFSQYCISV